MGTMVGTGHRYVVHWVSNVVKAVVETMEGLVDTEHDCHIVRNIAEQSSEDRPFVTILLNAACSNIRQSDCKN